MCALAVRKALTTPHGPIGTAVSSNIITRKADAKLGFVAGFIADVLGDRVKERRSRFLDKTLELTGFEYIDRLSLRYRMENRFFAIIYDLLIETEVKPREGRRPSGPVSIGADLKGRIYVSDAEWVVRTAEPGDDALAGEIATLLGTDLVRQRILDLDLADIRLDYDPGAGVWTIGCRSIIGSTTWNLIPPITQLISPKGEECVKLMEFFELAASCAV
jgi:hypothetical protein